MSDTATETDTAVDASAAVPLVWTAALSVGHAAIDDDHKRLFDLLNHAQNAVGTQQGEHAVRDVVRELLDYTIYHFGREEVVMRRHRYPDFLEHKKMHDEFVRKVATARDRLILGTGGEVILEPLLVFLRQWLVEHIQGVDKRMAHYVTNHPAE